MLLRCVLNGSKAQIKMCFNFLSIYRPRFLRSVPRFVWSFEISVEIVPFCLSLPRALRYVLRRWSWCSGGLIGDRPPPLVSPWYGGLIYALWLFTGVVDRRNYRAQVPIRTGIRYQMNLTKIEFCSSFNSSNFLSNPVTLNPNWCNSMFYSCNFS
jgi:hypothetical protein